MGFLKSIGNAINDVLGGTSSAKKAQNYALQQQAAQNIYNTETMQNLHQWEVSDLQKAGLNPALGYGGNTSGIATGTASGPQAATGNPIDMIATAVGIGNQIKEMELTSANKTKAEAETTGILTNNRYIDNEKKNQIANTMADTAVKTAEAANKNEERNLIKEETKYTKERSRGFTDSETRSVGSGMWGVSHSSARSISRTR